MPRISPETIEQIAAANDIVEVIGSYFPLKRAGGTYKALCPFHQEKSPSFTVNPHRQRFKCFGCGAGGSVFDFVMQYEHLEFSAAAKRLAERAGIRIVEEELSPEDNARLSLRRRLLALHADTAEWFQRNLFKTQAAAPARDYLKGRGITSEVARSWQIGYAPDSWDAFSHWARDQGYTADELAQSGLVKLRDDPDGNPQSSIRNPQFYDAFRGRVMFPICNDTGEVIAFSGRVLQADAKAAKYVNSPETILFTKGSVLFGLHRSKRALIDKSSAIVCEGQIDLITAFESGVQNVIAPQGTAFTEKQAHILKRYVEEVVLCFDADTAGQKAAERSLAVLLKENVAVRVVEMPAGEDPDSLIRGRGAAAFLERVTSAKDFFDYELTRLSARADFDTPRVRRAVAGKLAALIALIADPVLREAMINNVSARLEISAAEFARLVREPRNSATNAQSRNSTEAAPVEKPAPLDPTIRLLLCAILHDESARNWWLAAPWRELLAREPDAVLLTKILGSELPRDNPSALNAFLTTLEPSESNALCEILDEKPPTHPMAIAQDCWNNLARRQVQRRMDACHARLKIPSLPPEETANLQKEIVDLQKRLRDIPRPLSPPL